MSYDTVTQYITLLMDLFRENKEIYQYQYSSTKNKSCYQYTEKI